MGIEAVTIKTVLDTKLSDLFRATMPDVSGNEGFIGIAPDGSQYYVVVAVDHQIALGLKSWVSPNDGTPFGVYKGRRYFSCPTYEATECHRLDRETRLEKARENV